MSDKESYQEPSVRESLDQCFPCDLVLDGTRETRCQEEDMCGSCVSMYLALSVVLRVVVDSVEVLEKRIREHDSVVPRQDGKNICRAIGYCECFGVTCLEEVVQEIRLIGGI